jgi:hypothetical protein
MCQQNPGVLPVNDNVIDEIVRRFRADALVAVDQIAASLADRLRAISAPAVEPQIGVTGVEVVLEPPKDLITAARAADLAKRSKATIARWCKSHPWGEKPDGFAVFLRGRWFVSRSLFEAFLRSQ